MKLKSINWFQRRLLSSYLRENELMLGPMLGNLEATKWLYRYSRLRSGRVAALTDEDDRVCGVSARFNDGNMMLHAARGEDLLAFVPEIKAARYHTLWLLGCEEEDARALKEALHLDAHVVRELMMLQKAPVEVPDVGLTFQDISTDPYDPEYLETVCGMLKACFDYRPKEELMAERMAERTEDEVYLLGSLRGTWVCQAHIQAWTPNYGHIGGVAVLPEYTGQGLGRSITARLCRYIHESGRRPTLTVRENNAPAMAVYSALGFEPVGPVTVLDAYRA